MRRVKSVCKKDFMKGFTFLLVALLAQSLWAADTSKGVKRVAVLPFSMHAPSELSYLQDGVRDMLASRLAWHSKVEVLDKTVVDQAVRGTKSDITANDAHRIGKALNVDYVLFGSLTALGQAISIDAKMMPLEGNAEPLNLYTQTKTLDEVIPRINQFAQEINQKLFARPTDKAVASSSGNEGPTTRNPELLVPDSMISGDKASYLNPNFIELTPEGALRQPGLWRSQTFKHAVLGMDVGDLEGNGGSQIVTVTPKQVTVYKRHAQGLQPVATYDGSVTDYFMWVAVVDTNRDGKAEIYVTNLRSLNTVGAANVESPDSNEGFEKALGSFGLILANGKLQLTCKNVPYFLNGVEFRDRGKVLIGQQKGSLSDGPFASGIHEMQLKGDTLARTIAVSLPNRCNVFNFAKLDINGDHLDDVVFIDNENRLVVANPAGDILWRSKKTFGATTNSFEGKVRDRRVNDVDLYSVPPPIIVTDLNKDGIPEIIVTQNGGGLNRYLPAGTKYYDKGEIVSLSWDQLGLLENWKTREISGMVTSIRVADLDQNGTPQLLASMVLAKDFMKLWESKSNIFGYDLKTAAAPKTASKTP
jgi:TolB-like protein